MLVQPVTIDLNELFQNSCPTACTLDGIVDGIVVVTVHLGIVFVVRILGTKDCGADGAGKVVQVVLVVQRGDVASSKSLATAVAKKVKPPEVVPLAQWVLFAVLCDGKEFVGGNLAAVLFGSRIGFPNRKWTSVNLWHMTLLLALFLGCDSGLVHITKHLKHSKW